MRIDEIEARKAEIRQMLDSALNGDVNSVDVNALQEEVRQLKIEADDIAYNASIEAELRNSVAPEVAEEINKNKMEERTIMNNTEIRSSEAYAAAFLKSIKTGDESEARALLTVDASGVIPIPTMLENEIKTAWEENVLLSMVKQSAFKGNVSVGFELSATGASVHVEGAAAPDEEVVTIGVVEIKNETIKKWITVSDEALENTTVDTMGYLYQEIAHKIAEKAEELLIGKINSAPATASATAVGVPVLTAAAIAPDTIVQAVAKLSAQARNLNIVMNRQTYAAFVSEAMNANYAIDIFDGLKDRIVYSDKLPAFSAASGTYAIVGDFGYGAQANFPAGNDVRIKVDDLSLAEKDLVKLVGRQSVGLALVADRAFVKISK